MVQSELATITPALLTASERTDLDHYEATIKRAFYEAGRALVAIRDDPRKLYREHGTFEDYCQQRLLMSYPRAYQLIESVEVIDNIKTSTIVEVLPTNEAQTRPLTQLEPKMQIIAWQEAVETAPNGKVTAAHVAGVVQRITAPIVEEDEEYAPYDELLQTSTPEPQEEWIPDEHEVFTDPVAEQAIEIIEAPRASGFNEGMRSSATPEWYTPQHIINKVIEFFGHIDLDPCSNSNDPSLAVVPALKHYSTIDDGLSQPWHGRIYMNPPYGKVIKFWTGRLVQAWKNNEIYGALALVPARTDTAWFQPLFDYPVCFIRGRLQFIGAIDDPENPANFPSALIYLGNDIELFIDVFSEIGRIVQPVEAK